MSLLHRINNLRHILSSCKYVLKIIEWGDEDLANPRCPVCEGREDIKHKDNCRLKKALEEIEPQLSTTKETQYVLGFMFSDNLEDVALLSKNRPPWQKGKLNGVGGRVEKDETFLEAMNREFAEETGYEEEVIWHNYARLFGAGEFDVMVFASIGPVGNLVTNTDEQLALAEVSKLHELYTIDNLIWLVNLAIDHLTDGRPSFVDITYLTKYDGR